MSTDSNRIVVLDTETTGMNKLGVHYEGHKIIEIGAVEIVNRRLTGRHFHVYIKPDRLVDPEAIAVHGITDEFLQDKPEFAAVADEFINFIRGAELVIHNAPFDIGFMDYEFELLNRGLAKTETFCRITDTLAMARKIFPGKRNNLDALCDRYGIDNSHRTLHGALLDAEILADVYLLMTGGQTSLAFSGDSEEHNTNNQGDVQRSVVPQLSLKVVRASADELDAHESRLDLVQKKGGSCLWRV
ncbi:MAG TPA: DNA polymerase III subunit epsilon [Plesiomonas shigelloides]|uniref:DNA polymerase III subunit epsilon n=1 Tax=Plesiomonas shigelloides TaxID=703 RepID=UPI000EE57E9F|nr:DNA polymerase III subunit epsilon [Plesiomonas shigelloides]QIY09504.1 DNA polymerase III subunit epsilon [Plesiomonas shigelloides]HAD40298.1 DNA polymerase III subunit epsilon [Plesiomonas shigelloides]